MFHVEKMFSFDRSVVLFLLRSFNVGLDHMEIVRWVILKFFQDLLQLFVRFVVVNIVHCV